MSNFDEAISTDSTESVSKAADRAFAAKDEKIREAIAAEMRRDIHSVLRGPLKFLRPLF
ncbi:hypothetical protein [Litoreibacter roseus]|uniref:Uncharacterized protein n=1 Tax=Litoreibacter roseus TaxID=2601869 RepID=A0A6N6JHF2_9RHOB|nr:hypothetical protein [Litoreibacter roseus]GFE65545.1 hypothetical protein KIN_26190 [Litoreibacter roseus]